MIQYLVILLDDTSVSFCHYANPKAECRLMPIKTLKAGILFGMRENLNIQFVYPDYELPQEHKDAIETIDHVNIASASAPVKADVVILNGPESVVAEKTKTYVVRLSKAELFAGMDEISSLIAASDRVNVVITDIETFTDSDFNEYKKCLKKLADKVEQEYMNGRSPQLNILTDRMMLDKMNNCGAGDTTITLAPDGKFYVCPAFYLAGDDEDFGLGKSKFSIGDIDNGLDIKNPQLYKLDHAPLCRICDAWQCRRCVWLNRKTTYEMNTPSREQCVIAHLERNASRELLAAIRKHGAFMPGTEIKEIDYLDPFDVKEEW